MAHITADRIQERSWSTGTGPMTLGGAVDASYLPFSARLTAADTCHYLIVAAYNGDVTGQWELGLGTYASGALTRTAVYASSNADGPVSFASGQKFVTLVVAAPTTNTAAAWRGALGLSVLATTVPPGGTSTFLRADGNWAAPPGGGGGGGSVVSVTGTDGAVVDNTDADNPVISVPGVAVNAAAISAAEADIATNASDISALQADVAAVEADIVTIEGDVATNAADIATLTGDLALKADQSDLDATDAAVAGKEPAIAAGSAGQWYRYDKTWAAIPYSELTSKPTLGTLAGLSYPGGTTTYLRADGTWTAPTASVAWGGITGTLSSQTDLVSALNTKVNRAGDTMSGALVVPGIQSVPVGGVGILGVGSNTGDSALVSLQSKVAGYNLLQGIKNTSPRWNVYVGDDAAEPGSNVGSNFRIDSYSDGGSFLGTPLSIARNTGNLYTQGSITLSPSIGAVSTGFAMNKANGSANTFNAIFGQTNGSQRWQVHPGNGVAEAGGNSGSDFGLYRYADNGGYLGNPLSINRANGGVFLQSAPTERVVLTLQDTQTSSSQGANLKLDNATWGGARYLRTNLSGEFCVINNAYNQETFNVTNAGAAYVPVAMQAPLFCGGGASLEMDLWPAYNYYSGSGTSWPTTNGGFVAIRGSSNGNFAGAGAVSCYSGSGSTGVTLLNGANAWSAVSDERFKNIDSEVTGGLEALRTLRPIRYRYKTDAPDLPLRIGFTAQSVQPSIPEAVDTTRPVGESEDVLQLRTADILPHTVAAINELAAQVAALQARIAQLESK